MAFVSYQHLMFRAGWRSSCRSMEAGRLAEVAAVAADIREAAGSAVEAVDAPAVPLPLPVAALPVWGVAQRPGLPAECLEEAEHQPP